MVGFEVLAAVVMKGGLFWDIMLCGLVKINRHIGKHIASILRIEELAKRKTTITTIIPPKRQLAFPGLLGVMSNKTEISMWYTVLGKTTRFSCTRVLKDISFLEAEYSSSEKLMSADKSYH
jgi:hypothetical protein